MDDEYKKNYLNEVILRIDFPTTPIDIKEGPPIEFLKVILQKFPVPETKDLAEKSFTINLAKEKKVEIADLDLVREFWYFNENKKKSITVSKKYIYFDYKIWDKNSYDELECMFKDIIAVLFSKYEVQITRLGLRYINHIKIGSSELAPTEWEDYLNPNIISIFKMNDGRFEVSRAFQNLELILSDIKIRFQYGMHNPDYPAPIVKRLFILDYDGSCEFLQDQKGLMDNLKKINGEIIKLFRRSIGPKLDADMKNGEE